jgi:4-hydroxy-tetrahydrodipicolinate reductase
MAEKLRNAEVAIDFSIGSAVVRNISACMHAGLPLVEGTTGWQSDEEKVHRIVADHDGSFVYGANFSIGVNLFYRIVERAAELFAGLGKYEPFIEEAHHSRKRDAPSGTARRLQGIMADCRPGEIPIASTRAGHIPGIHRVGFDSLADQVLLIHEARSRQGFASGALLAASWIVQRRGFYEFSEVFDDILKTCV